MAPHNAPSTPQQAVAVDFAHPGVAVVRLIGEHDLSGKQRPEEALATASARSNVLVELIPPEATRVRRVAELTLLGTLLPIHDAHLEGFASLQVEARR